MTTIALGFVGLQCGTAAAFEQNGDFSKSPCAGNARHLTKGVAVRVFTNMSDGGQLMLTDGTPDWRRDFLDLNTFRSLDLMAAGIFDAWAVYGTLEDKTGKIKGFVVQYMLGDLASKGGPRCEVLPSVPERVEVEQIAPGALRSYLAGLGQSDSGNPDEMRARLRQFLKAQ